MVWLVRVRVWIHSQLEFENISFQAHLTTSHNERNERPLKNEATFWVLNKSNPIQYNRYLFRTRLKLNSCMFLNDWSWRP